MRGAPGDRDLVELAERFVPGVLAAELYSRDADPNLNSLLEALIGTLRWLWTILRVKRDHRSLHVLVAVTLDQVAVLAATTTGEVTVTGIEQMWSRDDVRASVDTELGIHLVTVRGPAVDVRLYPFVRSPAAREIGALLSRR